MGYSPPTYTDSGVVRASWRIRNYDTKTSANLANIEWIDMRRFATLQVTRKSGSGSVLKIYAADAAPEDGGVFKGPVQYVNSSGSIVDLSITLTGSDKPTEFLTSIYSNAFIKITCDAAAKLDLVFKT